MPTERIESLDYAERWTGDGLRAIDPPGGFLSLEVDMSQANTLRVQLRQSGSAVTYTHIIARAVASALTRHPELHRLVAGSKRLIPGRVDLCLSVAGDTAVTPVLILRDAAGKSLEAIADEVRTGAAQARRENEKMLSALRKWGWLVPASFLRRSLLRTLMNRVRYRRMVSGTFQVTFIPTVDLFVPFLFNTAAALSAGVVRDRVVALNGQMEIRPVLVLACCFDHKVWNGMEAAKFLNAVREELEQAPS